MAIGIEELPLDRLEEALAAKDELELDEALTARLDAVLELDELLETELALDEVLEATLPTEDELLPVDSAGGVAGLVLPDGPPPLPPPQATSAAQNPIKLAYASLTRKLVFGSLIICLPRFL